ncbi:hypothetical protein [Maribacter cobaltidurans]|uniref:Uncharacterized protein n=2 Tax=Maribacter cobaltidurans TaxID=1178778 RepID=A0A223V1N7_9FLAO|nr:hypothetical protein [Maribacter cobaltidurans]ASV29313.1 hypothetical protein CJ263_03240 [Maribacter cobaltidurans]GGD70097.1 hypothetical protein GCM10011412_04610 [Maribacter cobaltidurans]
MIKNIKTMFSNMNDTTREAALACLCNEFKLDDKRFIKKNWMIGGRIPEEYQERTVVIFQNLLREQANKLREIQVNL